jgi:hypothetical protein
MHKARSFFFVCAGIFLLALAYHLGAQSATAQAGSGVIGPFVNNAQANGEVASGYVWVMTQNGDVFVRGMDTGGNSPLLSLGNYWSGATPATRETWGQLKSRYRRGAAAAPQDK